jgi:hypothetical protein
VNEYPINRFTNPTHVYKSLIHVTVLIHKFRKLNVLRNTLHFSESETFESFVFSMVLFGLLSSNFFLNGVRLSPLGTSATNWAIVPAPNDRWVWSIWWNKNWQGKSIYREKTCHSATLSDTDPTCPALGLNPGLRGGKPATNGLSYGTAPRLTFILTSPNFQRVHKSPKLESILTWWSSSLRSLWTVSCLILFLYVCTCVRVCPFQAVSSP